MMEEPNEELCANFTNSVMAAIQRMDDDGCIRTTSAAAGLLLGLVAALIDAHEPEATRHELGYTAIGFLARALNLPGTQLQ
jgi:hypothetical protein